MANLSQSHFRFGKDDGTESAHTFWQLEDIDHTQLITADWTFLLRFCEQVTTAISNVDAQFQYNKNGAGWVNITTTSSVVKAVAVNAFTNGQACTKRLSGTGTFETSGAGCTEDGSSGGTANDIVLNGNSETEAGLQVIFADVVNGDTIQFRLTSPDATMVYTITPTLTIQKGATELGVALLNGTGLISGSFVRTRRGTSTLAGSGIVLAIANRIGVASSLLSGLGQIIGIGVRIRRAVGALNGTGGVVSSGTRVRFGISSLTATGTLSSLCGRLRQSIASLNGTGNVSSIVGRIRASSLSLSGNGILQGIGNAILSGKSQLVSSSGLMAVCTRFRNGVASLTGQGTVVSSAILTKIGSALFSGIGSLVGQGTVTFPSNVVTGVVSLIGTGNIVIHGVINRILGVLYSGARLYKVTSSITRLLSVGDSVIARLLTLNATLVRDFNIANLCSRQLEVASRLSHAGV